MKPKAYNGKLVQKLIFAAVAAIIGISVVLTVISGYNITNTYSDMVREELRVAAEQLQSEMTNVWDGDWAYDNEVLTKGGVEVHDEYEEIIDELKEYTGLEYSVFYGKERVLTTIVEDGKRIVGFNASDGVINQVINQKNEMYTPNASPAGASQKYYCYYCPLLQDDGTVAGMVFAGRGRDDVIGKISAIVATMSVISVILAVILSVIGIVVANTVSVKMRAIADEYGLLAQGELKLNIDESYLKRNDEIGLLADGAKTLMEKLGSVIRDTMRMSNDLKTSGAELFDSASQASTASSQVSEAVDDISRGAVNQAESVETAAGNTQDIGRDIDEVAENVKQLNSFAGEMKTSCEAAMEALDKLIDQSKDVQASVRDIGDTINSTNESAKEISKFSQAITEIASQTNLLSLNASIEAARAGDAGKGFAVVATEIGQLAVQSSNSAEEIKKIVEQLLADSEASVEVMQRLNASFDQQSQQLDDTQTNMHSMADNVDNVSSSTESIAGYVENLNTAKDKLVEIISDLSAISEENAASTEETNASMQELNATFSLITESANKLQKLAEDMTETISFFKP